MTSRGLEGKNNVLDSYEDTFLKTGISLPRYPTFDPANVRAGIQRPKSAPTLRSSQPKVQAALAPPIAMPPAGRVAFPGIPLSGPMQQMKTVQAGQPAKVDTFQANVRPRNGSWPSPGEVQPKMDAARPSAPICAAKTGAPKLPFMPVMHPPAQAPGVTRPPIPSPISLRSGLAIQRRIAGAGNMRQVALQGGMWDYYSGLTNDDRVRFRTRLASDTDYTLDQIDNWLRPTEVLAGEFIRNGMTIRVYGTGGRHNAHITRSRALYYFERYANEIVIGDANTLRIGDGRTTGYATRGNIKYSFDGAQIFYWHAHETGKMG